jgi:hypothetical protein
MPGLGSPPDYPDAFCAPRYMLINMAQVFISSTFREFEAERLVLKSSLDWSLNCGCLIAEQLPAESSDLTTAIKRWIDRAEIIVLLIGFHRGSSSPSGGISWTRSEIDYAVSKDKKILPYSKVNDPRKVGRAEREALSEFQTYIEEKVTPSIPRFRDTYQLIAMVVRDVERATQAIEQARYNRGFQ